MKTVITGKLTAVSPVEQKEKYSQQRIEVTVKEYDSTNGELKSEMVFPATIFNDKIAKLGALQSLQAHVVMTCYVKSIKSEKDGKVFHNLVLNAVELKEA